MPNPITTKSSSTCQLSSHFLKEAQLLKIWKQSQPASKDHAYLKIKKIKSHGIRQNGTELIIPMYNCNHKLQNLQRIFPDGKKLFLPDKSTKGCFYILDATKPSGAIYIAEGYATASTIYEATKQRTAVAFSANNLPAVAEIIKWEYPDKEIVICADNDIHVNNKNIGVDKATEAAMIIDAKLIIPQLKNISTNIRSIDFNELAYLEGIDEVRNQLANTAKVGAQPNSVGETSDEIIKKLAKMGLVEYGQVRKEEAAKLNIPVGFLDNAVKVFRQIDTSSLNNDDKKNELEIGIKPWDCKVDGSAIACKIRSLIEKHAILSEPQITVLTLWAFGTYCIDAFGIFPKLLITSPDKRCGKTTVLSILRSVSTGGIECNSICYV